MYAPGAEYRLVSERLLMITQRLMYKQWDNIFGPETITYLVHMICHMLHLR